MEQLTEKYNSVDVAKYIAAFWNKEGRDINMTKIQKLLYIAYGLILASTGKRLINEKPQAWPYGPVFPTSRNKLLKFKDRFEEIDYGTIENKKLLEDEVVKSLISSIYDSPFGTLAASGISGWSHRKKSPWWYTTKQEFFQWGDVIDDFYIRDYFKRFVDKD